MRRMRLFASQVRRKPVEVASCLAIAFVMGCGGTNRPETVPISGLVTFNGEPVNGATVTFYPENGRPASGRTDSEGVYQLTTFEPNDGALPGTHRVAIIKTTSSTPSNSPDELATIERIIPEKYASEASSGLAATVVVNQEAPIDFNLAD